MILNISNATNKHAIKSDKPILQDFGDVSVKSDLVSIYRSSEYQMLHTHVSVSCQASDN